MRQRKRVSQSRVRDNCRSELSSPELSLGERCGQNVFLTSAAVAVAVYVGFSFARYLKQLHENEMYFSAIQVKYCDRDCAQVKVSGSAR